MKHLYKALLPAAAIALIPAYEAAAKDYYAGKRIEVFLPVPAGGGLDRNARTFMNTFGKHVPGNPTIVMKNMPGGGGQRAINHVFAKGGNKGLRLIWGPMNFGGIVAGLPGIRYKPEEFKPLGAFTTPFVTIVRTDIVAGGMKSPADIMKAKNFVNGGRIPGGSLGTYGILSYNMLGLKYRHSIGYRNQPKLKAAIIQSEIQSLSTGNPGFWIFYANDLLKKGVATTLFYHPPYNAQTGKLLDVEPGFYGKGVDSFPVFYKKVTGKEPSGATYEVYKWWSTYAIWAMWTNAGPKTPEAQMKILRAAYAANAKDPDFLKRYKKGNKRAPSVLSGKDAGIVAKGYRKLSKAGVAELKRVLNVGRK